MPPLQEGPDLIGVAIVQNEHGPNQVGAPVGAPGMRAVAIDALGGPDLAPAVGGGRIHHVLIVGTYPARADPTGGSSAGPLCGGSPAGRRLGAQHHRGGVWAPSTIAAAASAANCAHILPQLLIRLSPSEPTGGQSAGATCPRPRANKRWLPDSFPVSSGRPR